MELYIFFHFVGDGALLFHNLSSLMDLAQPRSGTGPNPKRGPVLTPKRDRSQPLSGNEGMVWYGLYIISTSIIKYVYKIDCFIGILVEFGQNGSLTGG